VLIKKCFIKDTVCLSKKKESILRRSKRIDGGASYSSIAKEYEMHNTIVSGVKKNEDKKEVCIR